MLLNCIWIVFPFQRTHLFSLMYYSSTNTNNSFHTTTSPPSHLHSRLHHHCLLPSFPLRLDLLFLCFRLSPSSLLSFLRDLSGSSCDLYPLQRHKEKERSITRVSDRGREVSVISVEFGLIRNFWQISSFVCPQLCKYNWVASKTVSTRWICQQAFVTQWLIIGKACLLC